MNSHPNCYPDINNNADWTASIVGLLYLENIRRKVRRRIFEENLFLFLFSFNKSRLVRDFLKW
jgi:hypothetical protein